MLYRLRSTFRITFKRLSAQSGLTIATLLGLITAVALITTVPLYADAASFRILQESLDRNSNNASLPTFAYMYRYVGTWHGSLQWEDTRALDNYLTEQASSELGLPQQLFARHFETDKYGLFPSATSDYEDTQASLASINFVTTSSIADYINIFEGHFPETAESNPDSTLQVLVAEQQALELGLQVGDTFTAFNLRDRTNPYRAIPIEVAGIWKPKDKNDPFWFYNPTVFKDRFIITEESFVNRLAPYLEDEVNLALWYLVLDGDQVGIKDVGRIASNARRVEQQVSNLLPNTSNDITPVDGLQQYGSAVGGLTRLLAAFSVPLVGLILVFVGLMVGLSVNQRRNEIAVMRSRGATAVQILALTLIEGLILGGVALVVGLGGGLLFTQLMGQTRSFLNFSAGNPLRVAMTDSAVRAGFLAVGLAMLAQLLPTLAASRDTVITYKQDLARTIRPPWWQRAWLDVLLFIPAAYAIYLIQTNRVDSLTGQEGILANSGDLFQNPLLLFLPTLVTFSLTLFVLRLLPWFMALFSWLFSLTDSVSLLLATRQLARTPGRYAAPLLLLVLTVSLSVFTASLAETTDYQLYDESLYRVGAGVKLIGAGLVTGSSSFGASTEPQQGVFLPMSEYLEFPGVEAATRVGRFGALSQVGSDLEPGNWIGIDRDSFGQVTFWRRDFAAGGLGFLLNDLARTPDGALVSRAFMREHGLQVGDFFRLEVSVSNTNVPLNAQVVGAFDYFPTWYPAEDGSLFVGNLESLFQQVGGELPYEVWLRTSPDFDNDAFEESLNERRLFTWFWSEPYSRIYQEQLRPARQGLFGLLSVGFAATALLTVIGFFLYTLFSFRSRFIELGILRAVGLSARQMMVLVSCELAFLLVMGLGMGVALGMWISDLFVPVLQTAVSNPIPPYLVEIAWPAILQVIALFGLMFVVALAALGTLLARMKIFQAIKLGETV